MRMDSLDSWRYGEWARGHVIQSVPSHEIRAF